MSKEDITEGLTGEDLAVVKELQMMSNDRKVIDKELEKGKQQHIEMICGMGEEMKRFLVAHPQPVELKLPKRGWWQRFKERLSKTFGL